MSKKKHNKSQINYYVKDWHHILWQKRHWKNGWSKVLREMEYCGAYIPKATLHRTIHEFMGDIPVPDGKVCRQTVEALNSWLEAGYISLDDPIEKKLETLIKCFNKAAPATAEALRKELLIVRQFKGDH